MRKILLPVDGSVGSDHAVEYVIGLVREGAELDVYLMNVPTRRNPTAIRMTPAINVASTRPS